MSLAKMECKNPAVFDLETLQDIGDNIEILVIPYQAVIALDGYQTDVFGARHQHSQTCGRRRPDFFFSPLKRTTIGYAGNRSVTAGSEPLRTASFKLGDWL
ncbi:MAG: hypothetical protein VXX79_15100 [Pseudomonadota bacterium]|nr:hypothetical protein [Pseudomonadota bacterium]